MGKGGGGIVGGVSQSLFGDGGAKAAQRAAMQQQAASQQAFNRVSGLGEQATIASLASFDRDIKNQEKNLARQEQMISQIDPTIILASQQALRLLRGEQSSTLQPLQNQRNQQRQKLVNSLREQLGPGAETSTAGMQALTRFDSESSNIMGGAQQQALSGLGSIAGQFNQIRPDMFREISGLSSFGQGGADRQMQQAQLLQGAYQPLIQSAGANQTAAVMRGQSNQAFGQQLLGAGLSAATAYGMGDPTKKTRWFG